MKNKDIYYDLVKVEDKIINFSYEFKKTKRLTAVFKNKYLHIYSSNYLKLKDIKNFIIKNFNNLYGKYNLYLERFFSIENKILYLFGYKFKIEFKKDIYKDYEIDFNLRIVYIKNSKSKNKLINVILSIYKDVLDSYIYNDLLKKYNKYLNNYKITYQFSKTFLGRCVYSKKEIQINYLLAKYEIDYLKSTFVHELAHIYIKNHSKDFYNKMKEIDENVKIKNKNIILVSKDEI